VQALKGMALLLLCQSAGEVLARVAHLPLPGPVLGLLLLWLLLNWPGVRPSVASAAEPLLSHLSLLFVPVGVGVVVHAGLIAQYGVRMLAAVLLSTWLALAVSALVLRACLPRSPAATGKAAPR
jgi:holin-like protein